ncbi:FkbM family methyltransferase [Methylobacterium tarhaniae]|uniref:FkbM family methyltransferase n=1 Tax=Methylobacterium tarhaniae TaxID=1187852 RepID=UPI0009FA5A22|nr:FkbM family methyltransferase [Methylobacterium tarhaniae]
MSLIDLMIILYEDEIGLPRVCSFFQSLGFESPKLWKAGGNLEEDADAISAFSRDRTPLLLKEAGAVKLDKNILSLLYQPSSVVIRVLRRDAYGASIAALSEKLPKQSGFPDGRLPLDLDSGRASLMAVTARRMNQRAILDARKVPTITIDYEDIVQDPAKAARAIHEQLPNASRWIPNDDARQPTVEASPSELAVDRAAAELKAGAEYIRQRAHASPVATKVLAADDDRRAAIVYLVKDEEDIIFTNLAWHFAQGFRQFIIVNNASHDNTFSEIEKFRRLVEPLNGKVLILNDHEVGYYQGRKTTAAASLAASYFGAEWVFALDADEFLQFNNGVNETLFRIEKDMERQLGLRRTDPLYFASIKMSYFNYSCTMEDDASESSPIRRMTYRMPKAIGTKVAARWSQEFRFAQGNHNIHTDSGQVVPAIDVTRFGVTMRHFPQRSEDHFVRKVRNGGIAYANAPELSPGTGSHWRNWYKILEEKGESALRELFRANHVRDRRELKHDPMPRLAITSSGITIVPGQESALNLKFDRAPEVAIGGKAFEPTLISLKADPAPEPVALRLGTSDVPTFFQVFVRKDYEFKLDVRPRYILDLGANIGLAAAYFAGIYPEARTICVEPNPENFRLLSQNIAPYELVTAVHAAVWPRSTTLQLVEEDKAGKSLGFWGSQTRPAESKSGNVVAGISIPELMERYNLPTIDVLKVDIEGAELELFSTDSSAWIPSCQCIVVETHDRFRPGSHAAVMDTMKQHAFTFERSGENLVFRRKPT